MQFLQISYLSQIAPNYNLAANTGQRAYSVLIVEFTLDEAAIADLSQDTLPQDLVT
jgi:hypothetical protein